MKDCIDTLRRVLKAWDTMPEGYYSNTAIGQWLLDDMAPAMAEVRQVLRQHAKEEKKDG